jgi:hypothetical protein
MPSLLDEPRRKYGPPEHLHRVVPGYTRRQLYRSFNAHGYRVGAEIGVADGRNSLAMCEEIRGLELLCVDPWQKYRANPRGGPQSQHDGNYELARERLSHYSVRFVRAFSMDAVKDVPVGSLDFVYIDGHHGYEFVLADIREWSQRVRIGGVIAGHDFYNFQWAGVVEAVVEYTTEHCITDWHICDEREPSFWWVKRSA